MKRIIATAFLAATVLPGFGLFAAEEDASGSVKGVIFLDANGNGKFDEGEEVPAKITLLVQNSEGKWVPVEASYTIENGQFVFEEVPLGSYRVQFEFAGGIKRTTQSFELTSGGADAEITLPVNPKALPSLGAGVEGAPPTSGTNPGLFEGLGGLTFPGTLTLGGATSPFGLVNLGALMGDEVSTFKP